MSSAPRRAASSSSSSFSPPSIPVEEWIQLNTQNEELWNHVNQYFTLGSTYEPTEPQWLSQLPLQIRQRFEQASKLGALYIKYNGLFVAASSVAINEFGVYAWIDLEPQVDLTTYAGRAWDTHTFDLYFAQYPGTLLRKQRYLFSLGSDRQLDPTDLAGQLFDVHVSGNIAPYFNEPGYGSSANCLVTAVAVEGASPYEPPYELVISTCRSIPGFHELFILYENEETVSNGFGSYDLRNYLIGGPCASSPPPMTQPSSSSSSTFIQDPQQRLIQVRELYERSLLQEEKRIQSILESKEYVASRWIRPSINEDMIQQHNLVVWEWPFLRLSPNPKANEAKTHPYIWVVTHRIRKHSKIPVLGIPFTRVDFYAKLSNQNQKYMTASLAGYLDGNPSYKPWNHCGGDGAFMWVWIRLVKNSATATLEYNEKGYYEAKQDLDVGTHLSVYSST